MCVLWGGGRGYSRDAVPSLVSSGLAGTVERCGVSGPDAALLILPRLQTRGEISNTMISYILLVSRQGKFF